jgi:hypothetical protein
MTSPNQTEPEWLRDWRAFCDKYRTARGLTPPLTHEQRDQAWRVFCDRLEQERLRTLFSPKRVDTKLPLFPPEGGE